MTPQSSLSPTILITILLTLVVAAPPSPAQTFSVVATFSDLSQGFQPLGPLAIDAAGNLYGTTFLGGNASSYGTAFKVDPSGTIIVLHTFTGTPDGWWPAGGIVLDKHGTHIFGATTRGGKTSTFCGGQCGTIFKVDQSGKETVIYRFGRMHEQFGIFPQDGPIIAPDGALYGTATFGNPHDTGTVFRLAKGVYTVLHSFGPNGAGPDGAYPQGPLLLDSDGNLYGTTGFGGTSGNGTVYKIDTAGNETVLYSFTGGADGMQPWNNLVRDSAGNLYGTTFSSQFPGGNGVIFKLDPAGILTVLYTFTGGADGGHAGGIVRDAAGNIYGTTGFLGTGGTLFKLDTSGKKTVLHTFTGGADGAGPGPLSMDGLGKIYGAATGGGDLHCNPSGCGVIFKLTP